MILRANVSYARVEKEISFREDWSDLENGQVLAIYFLRIIHRYDM